MSNSQDSPALTPTIQEYSIRVPKNSKKKHHVMRFNSVLNIDFNKWSQIKMERENNQKEFSRPDDDQPKFGAGSEFGREAKEEARRKKYGIISRKYKPEDQPWILKSGGKTGKKFKGIREGGVGENAAYYVFTHANDGAIEAYPLCEWYNFQPINRYKSLSAEEAEQEFGRRNKVVNYFSLMLRRRLRNEDDGDLDEGEEGKPKKGGKKQKKDLKISDMDDWVDSDDDDSSEEGDDEGEEGQKEKKKKKKKVANNNKKKEKKKGSDDSAVEESDDGDEEGRELDYISDSSDSDSDHEAKVDKEMKGVAEESALRRLLNSDEEDEDEDENEENKKSDTEEPPPPEESPPPSASKKKKKKTTKKEKEDKSKGEKDKNEKAEKHDDSSSDFSPDSSDSEEIKTKLQTNSANSSRCASPVVSGDKRTGSNSDAPAAKKPRLETSSIILSGNDSGITEEAVRRYLMRKPMTTIELLQKFKCKKTGLSSEQLVNVMAQILKRINPLKQTIRNKMYFSLKPSPVS